MTKLTACLIVKNEELFIQRCIESLLRVSDEIIITDTGSIDKTKDICSNYPQVKVFDYEWDDNYSNPRNDGLKYATGDWILFVGADEVLSDELVKNLPGLLSNQYDNNTVFCFNVLNPSPNGITTSYFRQALFKNNQGIKFFRPIHEQLIKENEELININCPEMNIIHYNKMKLNQDLETKYSKYIGILNKAIENNNDKIDNYYYYHHLGNAYAQKNEHKKAYEAFLNSYNLYNEGKYDKKTLAYGTILIKLISQLVIYSDIKSQAQIYLDELFSISPDFTDGLFYQTIVFQENKEYEKALDNARK
ncbi:MAG: glycosyltransferase, partial [Candidatus Sericytochromatia bacterium]